MQTMMESEKKCFEALKYTVIFFRKPPKGKEKKSNVQQAAGMAAYMLMRRLEICNEKLSFRHYLTNLKIHFEFEFIEIFFLKSSED